MRTHKGTSEAEAQETAKAGTERPRIVASISADTAPCVEEARRVLEEAGYAVSVFPADGAGGRAMEEQIAARSVAGLLDITLTEWADELLGGLQSAGPNRLDAAAETGTPSVVVPGGLDRARFGPRETLPIRFGRRTFVSYEPDITLIRTDVNDNARLGRLLAEKWNRSVGPVAVCLPLRGLSRLGAPEQPFVWLEADMALFGNLSTHLRRDIPIYQSNLPINDPAFARLCAQVLLDLLA